MTSAPGMPTCTPPPIPAATYPPTGGYGIPFLAAITNGQVLAGYDEWTANNLVFKAMGKTYDLYPWQSEDLRHQRLGHWPAQLPSLTAEIPGQDIVFCDSHGAAPACRRIGRPASASTSSPSTARRRPARRRPRQWERPPRGNLVHGYSTPTFGASRTP